MKTTLISHFYNEEFLLPFWLKHHLRMFDHGIMIDYASTDRSVEIIRQLAPHWEIRPSRNHDFHYEKIDLEVMDIEKEFDGWKMALNTTEFLVHPNLSNYLLQKEQENPDIQGIRTTGLVMIDRIQDRNAVLADDLLVKQKHFGYVESDRHPPPCFNARCRLIHKSETGRYVPGRHSSHLANTAIAEDLFLCWFGWCPMDYVKERKLQIKTKIPPEHFKDFKGNQHDIDEQQLEAIFVHENQFVVDLWERVPLFKQYIDSLEN